MAVETDSATTDPVDHAAAGSPAAGAEQHATTEHGGGLPQFEIQHWAGQIGYLLILFVLLYALISRVFAPRFRRVFDARAATIAEALTNARAVRAAADEQAEAAKRAVAEARAAAQRTAAEAQAKAAAEAAARQAALDEQLAARQAEADIRIRAARDSAMAQLSAVAADVAEAMVQKLTGESAPRGAVAAAVQTQG